MYYKCKIGTDRVSKAPSENAGTEEKMQVLNSLRCCCSELFTLFVLSCSKPFQLQVFSPFLIWSKPATPREIKKKRKAQKSRLQLMFQAFCCFSQGTDLPTAVLGGNTHCRSSFSPVPVAEAQLKMKHFKTRFFLHVQPETPPGNQPPSHLEEIPREKANR